MPCYFMSYVYRYRDFPNEHHFGCSTVAGDEHPISKVKRWNERGKKEAAGRITVLLWWQEIPSDLPEIDVEN